MSAEKNPVGKSKVGASLGVILAIVLGFLVTISVLLYQKLEWVEQEVDLPPSLKVLTNRYYTAEQLLVKSDYKVRHANDGFVLDKLPPQATLVLFNTSVLKDKGQRSKLVSWVEKGGHLVLSPRVDENSTELFDLIYVYVKGAYCEDDDKSCQRKLKAKREALEESDASSDGALDTPKETKPASTAGMTIQFEGDSLNADLASTQRFYVDRDSEESVVEADNSDWEVISRFKVKKGKVTIVPLELFSNSAIKRYDHGKLWLHVTTLPGRDDTVYLVRYISFPNLIHWLSDKAPYTLLALILCILLILWRHVPRFGALIPTPPPVRPSLTEHLKAVAAFLLRNRNYNRLLGNLREETLQLLQPLKIHYPGSRSDAELLAQLTQYDIDLITQAFETNVQQLNEFTQHAQTLCGLIDRLNALQRSASRRFNYGI
ncbi:hypothetical protein SOASR030_27000 [Leminorella grimontii]|uniref:DUF4350 domain-containing protein n=1 Tax=Leminorella grimontii TaxID=82981 RepID=A0AAV5N6V0_9GAMM|nr:DUF4350 domain-containing protein [Leminorella grimontii]KFC94491.1 hypothetical protein GLGR_2605 [Leminorella grimontii ATCC 33999 = DSM 5078]GKX56588.1 hypothetical protein SOASR030_27000 [Leminorella grimontii]VFS61698.1 Uncharacterised protein [Leminorella grimontii]